MDLPDITVFKKNDVYMQVACGRDIAQELYDFFSFKVPGHQFMPKFKAKIWDGKIHLYSTSTGLLYVGLHEYLKVFAKDRQYTIKFEDDVGKSLNITFDDVADIIEKHLPIHTFNKATKTWEKIVPYTYQVEATTRALQKKRVLLLSATSSGKSLILYLISRILLMSNQAKKILVIVPSIGLVEQTSSDFLEYGYSDKSFNESFIHKIYGGKDKQSDKPITFSTWQSLQRMDKSFFDQFDCCFVDEAHLTKAKSLTDMMMKLTDCPYKIGTTGTIEETEAHKLVLEGLLGPVCKVITARELIQKGLGANMKINAMILKYRKEDREHIKKYDYASEFEYLLEHPARNKFIKNLVTSLKGNSLVLYERVEAHGIPLYEAIKEAVGKTRNVYIVHKDVTAEEREKIRKAVERDVSAIIVASYGTFSTGISIKNLHNLVFASPSKSMIRICQSLGRGLRKSSTKQEVVVYDIIDDLTIGRHKNYIYRHGLIRLDIYDKEKHPYSLYNLDVKETYLPIKESNSNVIPS